MHIDLIPLSDFLPDNVDRNEEKVGRQHQTGGHVFDMAYHLQAPDKLHCQHKIHGRHTENGNQGRGPARIQSSQQGSPEDSCQTDQAKRRPASCPDRLMQLGVNELLAPDFVRLHFKECQKDPGVCSAQHQGKKPHDISQCPVLIFPEKTGKIINAENCRHYQTCRCDSDDDQKTHFRKHLFLYLHQR